jgi:hypothetical protein
MPHIVMNGRKLPRIATTGRGGGYTGKERPQPRFHPPSNLTLQKAGCAMPSGDETYFALLY